MASSLGRSPLRAVGHVLPERLQRTIADTPLYEAYLHARKHTAKLEIVEFEAGDASIVIDVPTESYRRDDRGVRIYEPGLTRELLDVLGPGDVFYDVGSHHGYLTELARVAGVEESAIHCFEADTFNEYVLNHNVEETDVTVTGEFVGTDSGMCSIDDYVETNLVPTVVKVDVEGAEYDVLESMRSTLTSNPVTLYIEIHPGYLPAFEASVSDVQSLLSEFGYDWEISDHRSVNAGWSEVKTLPADDGYLLRATPADD